MVSPTLLRRASRKLGKLAASPSHDKGGNKGMSLLKEVYCCWPVACSLRATLQKEFAITICRLQRAIIDRGYVGPDLGRASGGWGTLRSGPGSRKENRLRLYN
jgi:hypothetical protein